MNAIALEPAIKSNYRISQVGKLVVVTYKRVWYSPAILIPMYFLNAAQNVLIGMIANSFHLWVVLTIFTSPVLYFLINTLRKDGGFTVSGEAIVLNHKIYKKRDITEICLKSSKGFFKGSAVKSVRVIYNPLNVGSRLAAQTYLIGASIDNLGSQAYSRINDLYIDCNYQVGIIASHRYVKLAGGLDEAMAEELYEQLGRLVQDY